jgi:hypothetical protein
MVTLNSQRILERRLLSGPKRIIDLRIWCHTFSGSISNGRDYKRPQTRIWTLCTCQRWSGNELGHDVKNYSSIYRMLSLFAICPSSLSPKICINLWQWLCCIVIHLRVWIETRPDWARSKRYILLRHRLGLGVTLECHLVCITCQTSLIHSSGIDGAHQCCGGELIQSRVLLKRFQNEPNNPLP